jgi:hypothetical protein
MNYNYNYNNCYCSKNRPKKLKECWLKEPFGNENQIIFSKKQVNDYTSLFVPENSPFWSYTQPYNHTPTTYVPWSVEYPISHIPYIPHRIRPIFYHPLN